MNALENLRLFLYYPLGLLPLIFFTLRFLIQWIQSEKRQKSGVTPIFWKLSLPGNILQLLHYIIQLQFPFALIQAGNAVISWRNLNLFKPKAKQKSLSWVMMLFFLAFMAVTASFVLNGWLLNDKIDWIRVPNKISSMALNAPISWAWHALGFLGTALFASRFWVQWWQSEKELKSDLGKTFWQLSIIGSILSLIYFIYIQDVVSIINYSFGLVPYLRNLMLLKNKAVAQETS